MARLGPTGLTQVFVEIKNWVVSKLSSKANDSDVVHKSEDETITGIKVFNNSLVKTGSGNWGNILTLKNIGTIKNTAPDSDTFNNAIRFASSDYTGTYYTTEAEIAVQKLTTGDNRFTLAVSSNSNTSASGMASLSLYGNKTASWNGDFTATTFNGDLVGNVTGTADKAIQDSDGNQINTTYSKVGHTHDDRYYTESEVNNLLDGKANTSGTYSSLTVGNASTATKADKLTTTRTISLAGDVIGSTSFNGSANASISTTLSNIDASKITSGTIDIARIPKAALAELKIVENDDARFALTTSDIQNGDTVKVESTGKMYYVKDQTKLSTEDGYTVYTADQASSIDWSGVINKPTTFTPSSHTHGQITNDGMIGTAANKPLITTTGGVVTTGSFGTVANTF